MVAHASIKVLGRLREEDLKLKTSLGCNQSKITKNQ
jgi:hypothetical protein